MCLASEVDDEGAVSFYCECLAENGGKNPWRAHPSRIIRLAQHVEVIQAETQLALPPGDWSSYAPQPAQAETQPEVPQHGEWSEAEWAAWMDVWVGWWDYPWQWQATSWHDDEDRARRDRRGDLNGVL